MSTPEKGKTYTNDRDVLVYAMWGTKAVKYFSFD